MLREGVLYRRARPSNSAKLVVPPTIRFDTFRSCYDDPAGGHLLKYGRRLHVLSVATGGPEPRNDCLHKALRRDLLDLLIPEERNWCSSGAPATDPNASAPLPGRLTRWLVTVPVPDTSTKPVLRALERNVLCHFGACEVLISDRRTAFTSQAFEEAVTSWGIRHVLATAERPQTNGLCERVNRTLVDVLRCYINDDQGNWEALLHRVTLAINTAKSETTRLSLSTSSPVIPVARTPRRDARARMVDFWLRVEK